MLLKIMLKTILLIKMVKLIISPKLKNPFDELTEEVLQDQTDTYNKFFNN